MKTNHKNNRTVKIFSILAGSLILFGCSEEFLKPEPLSYYDPAKTFNTVGGLEATMAMCDRNLRSYWSHYDLYRDRSLPISTEAMFSEQAVAAQTDNASIFTNIAEVLTPTNRIGDGDDNCIAYFWNENYNGIKYANSIITYIDKVDGLDESRKNEFLGRAYFHRAFRYYALCFQFNNVPLVPKLIEEPKIDWYSTKREAILEMITADMENAVKWVPEQSNMKLIGMISKGACRQLLIKCYLATGQFEKAKEQADILIDNSGYSLMKDNFGTFDYNFASWKVTRNVIWDLHRPENKSIAANKEVILSMPNRYGTDAAIRLRSMRNWLPMIDKRDELKSPAGRVAISFFTQSETGSFRDEYAYSRSLGRGIAHIRPTYYTTHALRCLNGRIDEGDLRQSSAMGNWVRMDSLKYNDRADRTWFGKNLRLYDDAGKILCTDTIRAWFDWPHYKIYLPNPDELDNPNNADHRGGPGDWYCYRLAETYLLRAEAKFYLGDIAGATNDVNEIRKRAKCNELYSTVTIGDIMDERARELYLEEFRHVELARVSLCLALCGKADEFGKTYSIDKLSEDSYWWQRVSKHNNFYNKGVVCWQQGNRPYTIASRNIYWPIPQSAIRANREGKLRQNPGYDGYDPSVPIWETWQEAVADVK